MRSLRSIGWIGGLVAVVAVLVVVGGTGAALCKLALDCGFRGTTRVYVEDYEGVGGGSMSLPEGLSATTVAAGLEYPTDFDFLPDGGIVVAEKSGLIRVLERGELREQPFLDLRPRVNTWFFRGVMDVTVDPGFPRQPFVYVMYAVRGAGPPDSESPTVARVSRFRVSEGRALLASEQVILGRDGARPCATQEPTSDCLPAEGDHVGGDIAFLPDGTMFVATGDGSGASGREGQQSFTAQDLDTLGGKILHVDREGRGLEGNPYWNGDASANRSKVWAYGFRNPFRIALGPDDSLLVADVGAKAYEEVNVVRAGSDHGWPCREGPGPAADFASLPFCETYEADASPEQPWLAIPQPEGSSVTGGVVLESADGWPEPLADRYLFGDWGTSEIATVPLAVDEPAPEPEEFASSAGGPVAFGLGPDDGLYYLALNVGELRRIATD
jgi:glucose/arabinose dehydrogenase